MTLKKQMAIMSHLSDCQEMLTLEGQEERIRMRINFVKMILCDEREEFTTNELDEIWEECNEKYGIKEEKQISEEIEEKPYIYERNPDTGEIFRRRAMDYDNRECINPSS